MRRLTFLLILLTASQLASAQASIVPAQHPVYDWLWSQRVEGRVPTYQHEVRPMSRATIVAHLRTLADLGDKLSSSERKLLTDFRNEFEMDRLIATRGWSRGFVRGLPTTIPVAIRERWDPVLVATQSGDSLVSGALYASVGVGHLHLNDSSVNRGVYATTRAVRTFLNFRFGLGWHFEADNIWADSGRAHIRQIQRYDTEAMKPTSLASYEYESFVSYRAPRFFDAWMGWGSQALGPAITDPLVLRDQAPFFTSLRYTIGGPKLNLVYVHGSLRTTSSLRVSGTDSMPIYDKVAPERLFAGHRLTWMPTPRLSLTYHEQVVYANRGPDLHYLNPVAPLSALQARLDDRDNLLIGGDFVFRPWNGSELSGTLLIDDVDDTFGPAKKAVYLGVTQRLLPGVRLAAGYTATDPWAYTHWLRVNTYESGGRPLGPQIGPNAEEFAARATVWLPLRTRVMGGFRHIKKGLDPAGADSILSMCVGGNLYCGRVEKEQPRFQGADVHVTKRLELEVYSEPIRGIPVTLAIRDDRVVQGTRLKSSKFMDLRVRLGY